MGLGAKNEPPREDLPSQITARGGFLGGIGRKVVKGGPVPSEFRKPGGVCEFLHHLATMYSHSQYIWVFFCKKVFFAENTLVGKGGFPSEGVTCYDELSCYAVGR